VIKVKKLPEAQFWLDGIDQKPAELENEQILVQADANGYEESERSVIYCSSEDFKHSCLLGHGAGEVDETAAAMSTFQ
jgi:hypothetical protein